jgi:hypothetical protein
MARSLALVLALCLSQGCAVISSDSNQSPQNALTVRVSGQPPDPKQEGPRPESPGFGHIWVQGYWDYLSGNFVWRDGRWVQGRQNYEYFRARYEFDGKGWVFHRPHWRKRPTPQS